MPSLGAALLGDTDMWHSSRSSFYLQPCSPRRIPVPPCWEAEHVLPGTREVGKALSTAGWLAYCYTSSKYILSPLQRALHLLTDIFPNSVCKGQPVTCTSSRTLYTLSRARGFGGCLCFWKGVPVPVGDCSLPRVNSAASRSGLARGFPKTGLLQHSESFQTVMENNA